MTVPTRLIERDHLDPFSQEPLGELAPSTADVQNPLRRDRENFLHRDVLRLRAVAPFP